ncbi:MFS transporter [Tumebacillus flagellatus]|uniref:Major facilitator superfamily (MFS) profile domain-containing protein n=1 Tax=Tumebacillus flagellatus TaxID=1157490 RepID=A0A074LTN0_9BACL|nr:MFS transporter [Tumebacillus flagellatus]KEO83960.1 hypothetical protein EL26_07170 [Tumebacillus flagellatus]
MNRFMPRYLIYLSQFFSEIGDWFSISAVMLLIYHVTESPLMVSGIAVLENIAIIAFSALGGVIVDRYNPKRMMLISDLLRGMLILLIPFFHENIAVIFVVQILIVTSGCIFTPAKMKIIRKISSDDELAMINGTSSMLTGLVKIIGVLLGGIVVGLFGYDLPFYFDSASYLLSAFFISFILYRSTKIEDNFSNEDKKSVREELKEGWSGIRKVPPVPQLLIIFTLGSFIMGLFVTQIVVYNSKVLQGTELTYGYLNCAMAVGVVIVSSLFSKFVSKWEPYQTIIGSTFLGVGVMLISMTFVPFPYVLVVLFFLGVFQTMPNLVAVTICLRVVPESLLGRFFGLLNLVTTPCYITGMLVGGSIATWSVEWMYRGAGLLAITLYVVAFLTRKRFQGGVDDSSRQQVSS